MSTIVETSEPKLDALPATSPAAQIRLALLAGGLFFCLFFWAKPFLRVFLPQQTHTVDFHQEWLSARNYWAGWPIYLPIPDALARHTGQVLDTRELVVAVNAHPPTSVLLTLPFGRLNYRAAFLLWNTLSLLCLTVSVAIIARELRIADASAVFVITLCALVGTEPFYIHFLNGQLGLWLLFILTGVWWADRRGWASCAGALLGLAVAIKLFPGFLFLYFLLRRDWRALMAGIVSLAALTGMTAAVLGVDTYREYVTNVLPQATLFEAAFKNASLPGLWMRLFAPNGRFGPEQALIASPALAWGLKVASVIGVALVVSRCAKVSPPREAQGLQPLGFGGPTHDDDAFAVTLLGMLLIAPVTWEHYFVLLPLPLAMWCQRRHTAAAWIAFAVCQAILWLPVMRFLPQFVPDAFEPALTQPWHSATVHALQCYALLAWWGMMVRRMHDTRQHAL